MHYRLLNNTGLYVSELCLGTMTFGGGDKEPWDVIGALGATDAEAFIGSALDAGESEKLVGAALAALKRPREQVIVASKVHGRTGTGVNDVGLSRGHILAAVDASLSRLHHDYLDLYQIHGVDPDTPIEETVRALDDIVRAGKVRYVGFCNLPAWLAMQALAYAEAHGYARFISAQMYYSLASRDIEREIVPLAQKQGLAILPWSPLAGGLLSGKYEIDKPGPEGARRTSFDFPIVDKPRAAVVIAALRAVAAATGLSVSRIALAWLLTRPCVTSVIIGAKKREQLLDNLGASEVQLAPEHIAQLDAASALPPEYPGWMLEWQMRNRRPATAR